MDASQTTEPQGDLTEEEKLISDPIEPAEDGGSAAESTASGSSNSGQ